MDSRDIEMLGIRIINEKENGAWETFRGGDIVFIDNWYPYPKSNHCIPRFHTTKGMFTMINSFAQCKEIFSYLDLLDSSNLIDLDKIDHCEIVGHNVILAYFKDSDKTANVAWSKRSKVKHLIRHKEEKPETRRK